MVKKHFIQLIFLCILFCGIYINVYAQEQFSDRYNITYVTMDNGLLHNYIDDIYKDTQGFLWISTGGGGLSRYDGYEFIHYNTNTSPVKLKSNFPKKVCEDNFQRLWIVSEGGTDILDLKSMQLIAIPRLNADYDHLFKQAALDVINDSQGNIWICCESSIHQFVFNKQGYITKVFTVLLTPPALYTIALSDLDKDGNVWVGVRNKIYKLYPSDNGELPEEQIPPFLEVEHGNTISSLCLKENEIWVGTHLGLIRYNKNEKTTKRYLLDHQNPHSISQNYITDIAVTQDKQLLVSTLRGLNIYNPMTDGFQHVMQETKIRNSRLNSNFINCILIDKDIIWIGSETGGINKVTPRRLRVQNYIYNKEEPNSISRDLINAIYEDRKENLWVGTVEGGLNLKTKGSNKFTHFTTDPPARLTHNSVSALATDENNRLWVGTWGGGINLLNLNNPSYPTIKYISPNTYPELQSFFIGTLCYDPINKGMWIGTNPGLYFYDIETDSVFIPIDEKVAGNIPDLIGSVIDSQGYLWIGSMEGVYIIDLHSRNNNHFIHRHLRYKLDNPESGLIEKISCFHLASDSSLWIGSKGYGVYHYQPEDNSRGNFTAYTTSHGLISNNIRGILEDEKGKLWISTNKGLSCFDPASGHFTNYTKEDGLSGNQFYWNAYGKSKSGLLYFGGLNGLTAIESNQQDITPAINKVTFTHLRVANEEVLPGNKYIDTNISFAPTVRLHESDKSFSLEFSSLNYQPQQAAMYSYRLIGFDENWTEVPASRRFANYTNLPAGKYTLQVKYSSKNDTENCPVTELDIIVTPFFYKTWWFIFVMIMLLSCSVVYIYLRRLYKLQKQKELLHRMVEERTQELKEQNEKITKQKTQLIHMSKKVQELTLDKLAFFTNITHEFRTPITLIIGPIEKALKLSYNPQVIEQLNFVERNSKYLLSLVNQLMDFRKVESGKLDIVKTHEDFLKFLDILLTPFRVFAAERNIRINKYYRMGNPVILFDQDAMQKVITNLLSNAIKFTPDGGIVTLYVISYVKADSQQEELFIGVRDTGMGIPDEDLSKIFSRFYQSHNHTKYPVYGQSGTGIGLYLCHRIVKLHGGTIKAYNNKKRGSTFSIKLPLQREDNNMNKVSITDSEQPLVTDKHIQEPSSSVPDRLTFLIVEDNRDMRAYIRSILTEKYNTLEAENGAVALSILENNSIDFIISDLMMPVMDGIELSRQVKANFNISHIPFLMLTAKTSQESRIESYRMGVDEYLLKPFSEELLLARVANILENRRRYQQRFATNMNVEELQIVEDSNDKKFLDKAFHIIEANYKNSYYEASDFIEAMGVSKSLANKKLQILTGQSIGQFIRNYRLNIARQLIDKNRITKNMNISEIAYEVGFNDPKYFTRCFTKRYDVTPSSLLEESM